jgi:glycosyltransferase involved in cell wall biosynthesis
LAWWQRGKGILCHDAPDPLARDALYQQAGIGYCGEGMEHETLALNACGTPVVCPATPSGKEYVLDGETGLLFEPGNRRQLADKLQLLASDDALRKRLGEQAQERARRLSWDRTAGLVLATLEIL